MKKRPCNCSGSPKKTKRQKLEDLLLRAIVSGVTMPDKVIMCDWHEKFISDNIDEIKNLTV